MKNAEKINSAAHKSIQAVIEETTAIYTQAIEAGGQPNLDYAGFASEIALHKFRQALGAPNLPPEKLESLLRQARGNVRDFLNGSGQNNSGVSQWQNKPNQWAYLMAHYVAQQANTTHSNNTL